MVFSCEKQGKQDRKGDDNIDSDYIEAGYMDLLISLINAAKRLPDQSADMDPD